MRRTIPSSAEREQAIQLLQSLYSIKRQLWRVLVTDKDWKKGLYSGALFLEDDSRFNFWFHDLLEVLQIPWDRIKDE